MPIAQALHGAWFFWDGRADSLWAQALGPIENPREHDFTRSQAASLLGARFRASYEPLFGPIPDMSDRRRFPLRASPNGNTRERGAWAAMASVDRETVDRLYANMGKAIAAYERTLTLASTRFDGFVAGLVGAGPAAPLSRSEEAGLRLFLGKGRCTLCHSGPIFSNGSFANTGVPPRSDLPPDLGRLAGASQARADPFNCRGPYSDAGKSGCDELDFLSVGDSRQTRSFKVPSLRGVGQRAPYMHAGQFATLDQVIAHYNRAPRAAGGTSELKPLHLTPAERRALVAFLHTLDAPVPDPRSRLRS
jgi:cytochrome c peroxidase